MLPIYHKLFNLSFSAGTVPEIWTIGVIKPVYKNKGDPSNPDNYRPITILSCLGKLFTAVLNQRLTKYVEQNSVIGEDQLGFRQKYSTIDGVFILHALCELAKNRSKSIYAAFIDLKKAFSSVSRPLLFSKLVLSNIGQKLLKTVKAMYRNIKSCVSLNGKSSPLFQCQVGLREGDNLSPILFSLYLNDLNDHLTSNASRGVTIDVEIDNMVHFLNIFLVMYADDTVLLAESKTELQGLLSSYETYCDKWKLQVNVDKTKIMILGKNYRKPKLKIADREVEVVNSFKYLGVTFCKTGRYINAVKENVDSARRAFFLLLKYVRQNDVPLDCQVDLFCRTIEPILLYGAEVWGFEHCPFLEKYRLRCLKILLKVKNSTPSYMIYGELGLRPLECEIKKRVISFWYSLLTGKQDKLSFTMYLAMYRNSTINNLSFKWLSFVKNIIQETGFYYMWTLQAHIAHIPINSIKKCLNDQYMQMCMSVSDASNKKKNYMWLKDEWRMEPYICKLNLDCAFTVLKFRTSNHKLPVETGRYFNIDYKDRICPLCNTELGDEYHYLFTCTIFQQKRLKYLPQYFIRNPNMFKYKELLGTSDVTLLQKMCKLIREINKSM